MKKAVCHRCGKCFKCQIPDNAEQVTCFACDQISPELDAAISEELAEGTPRIMREEKGDLK